MLSRRVASVSRTVLRRPVWMAPRVATYATVAEKSTLDTLTRLASGDLDVEGAYEELRLRGFAKPAALNKIIEHSLAQKQEANVKVAVETFKAHNITPDAETTAVLKGTSFAV